MFLTEKNSVFNSCGILFYMKTYTIFQYRLLMRGTIIKGSRRKVSTKLIRIDKEEVLYTLSNLLIRFIEKYNADI